MMKIIEHWEIITAAITGIVAWFGGRKLQSIDEQDKGSTALQNMQGVYKTLTEQIQREVEGFRSDIKDLKAENVEQRADLRALQKDNSKLHLEVSRLMEENNELKRMIAELRRENEELRQSKANKK